MALPVFFNIIWRAIGNAPALLGPTGATAIWEGDVAGWPEPTRPFALLQEDVKLIQLVETYGPQNWSLIAKVTACCPFACLHAAIAAVC